MPTGKKKHTGYIRHLRSVIRKATNTPEHITINERRFVDILSAWLANDADTPPWLHKVELGTLPQDYEGIDVVVTSDVGPLFVQIKSSDISARQFLLRQERRRADGQRQPIVDIVIVNDKLTDSQILVAGLRVINNLRHLVTHHGSSFYPPRHKGSLRNGTS